MDFELAQLLEAAGWPQGGRGKWIIDPSSIVGRRRLYQPTLEELFEGCGAQLIALRQGIHPRWTASAPNVEAGAATPAEAVAWLWLQLEGQRMVRPASSLSARP
jgi:hypothetical protein